MKPVTVALASVLRGTSVKLHRMKGTGLPRVSEKLRSWYQRHWSAGPIEIKDFRGSLRFLADPSDHMGSRIFWFGAYSPNELDLLTRLLKAGDTFIDVGANAGEFTVAAALCVGIHGRVIALEPVPALRENLRENVQRNGFEHVTIVDEAVSDSDGTVQLFGQEIHPDDPHSGLPSAFQTAERPRLVATVPQTTLDAIVDRLQVTNVHGIKFDIEGAELAALRGSMQSIQHFRPWIMIEIGANTCEAAGYEPIDVVNFLRNLGYELNKIQDNGLVPLRSAADLDEWQNVLAMPAAEDRRDAPSQ